MPRQPLRITRGRKATIYHCVCSLIRWNVYLSSGREMDKKGVPKQQYVDTLDGLSRQRYLDKLRMIDDVDSYTLPSVSWTKDEASFPAVSYPDSIKYLIFGKSFYTMDDMKAWKSLEKLESVQPTNIWVDRWSIRVCEEWISRCKREGKLWQLTTGTYTDVWYNDPDRLNRQRVSVVKFALQCLIVLHHSYSHIQTIHVCVHFIHII